MRWPSLLNFCSLWSLATYTALQDGRHTCPKRPTGDWMAKVDLKEAQAIVSIPEEDKAFFKLV